MNKQWSESPFIRDNRDALSKDVCDLLDRIFVIDPRKRITIPEIMKHPWYEWAPQRIAQFLALACMQPAASPAPCSRLQNYFPQVMQCERHGPCLFSSQGRGL